MTESTSMPAPPSEYLVRPPTDAEHLLAEQVDLHDGSAVPFWMFAKLATREHRTSVWMHSLEATGRRIRRHLIAVIGFALVNVSAVGGYFIHRLQEGAVADERAAVQDRAIREWRDTTDRTVREWRVDMLREIDGLRTDVRELRASLRKVTGDVPKGDVSYASVAPLLRLRPDVEPAFSCADVSCFASIDCRDPFTNCHYCYQGHCSSVLPAEPEPSPTRDAGVDAPDKGTSL